MYNEPLISSVVLTYPAISFATDLVCEFLEVVAAPVLCVGVMSLNALRENPEVTGGYCQVDIDRGWEYFGTMIRILILLTLLPAAYGEGPNFEVASIRPAPPIDPKQFMDTRCHGGPGTKDPGRWTCANISLSNLVVTIFDLKGFQIGAVASVSRDRFTIAAKVPEGATEEQFRQMQQNLLIERFGLKFHREKREIQGYELIVAKDGPKFKESEPEPPKDPDAGPDAVGPSLSKMTTDKDGFPVIPPGRTQVIMRGGPEHVLAANGVGQQWRSSQRHSLVQVWPASSQ